MMLWATLRTIHLLTFINLLFQLLHHTLSATVTGDKYSIGYLPAEQDTSESPFHFKHTRCNEQEGNHSLQFSPK